MQHSNVGPPYLNAVFVYFAGKRFQNFKPLQIDQDPIRKSRKHNRPPTKWRFSPVRAPRREIQGVIPYCTNVWWLTNQKGWTICPLNITLKTYLVSKTRKKAQPAKFNSGRELCFNPDSYPDNWKSGSLSHVKFSPRDVKSWRFFQSRDS